MSACHLILHVIFRYIYLKGKKKRRVKFVADFNSSLNIFFFLFYHDLNAAHVLNKCSKFHLVVANNSPVIQVHW